MILVSAAEMRRLDRLTIEKYGTPGYTLMQRAGRGATALLRQVFPRARRARVVICAGHGNNGGDGFVIGRELKAAGAAVEVHLLGAAAGVKGDAARALAAYRRARGKIVECTAAADLKVLGERLTGAAVAVDAIFGTGLKGEVKGIPRQAIELLNDSQTPVFAVDIPSGLDSDRGVPLGAAVRARATATFGFAKLGQVSYPGVDLVGRLGVIDIGIAPQAVEEVRPAARLLEAMDAAALVPRRQAAAHKGDAGHLLVIAGGRGKTGAAMLAARAATRAGAGLVTLAGPASQQPILAGGVLEAMTELLPDEDGRLGFDEGALAQLCEGRDAVVFGPGVGTGPGADKTLAWLLDRLEVPLVLDADGLNCAARDVSRLGRARGPVLVTPHPGEMARLLGSSTRQVQADRPGSARALAAAQRCTVVLKGARSLIAGADGSLAVNPTGNPGMASGGMGDVLSGILGALLGQGLSPFDAACLGVYAHGLAADLATESIGPIGIIASDVFEHFPRALRRLLDDVA